MAEAAKAAITPRASNTEKAVFRRAKTKFPETSD
jgi:hypothetical protein